MITDSELSFVNFLDEKKQKLIVETDPQFRLQCKGLIFTVRRYASAVLAVIVCLSVCPSVCLSQVGVVQRWLNLGSD